MAEILDLDVTAGFWPKSAIDLSLERVGGLLAGHGIDAACLASARGILYDHAGGNRETLEWAAAGRPAGLRIVPAATIDPRRFVGYRDEIRAMTRAGVRLWRLFPEHQGWDFCHPAFRRIVGCLEDQAAILYVKGRPGAIWNAISGARLPLIIGTHFYDLAEALALWEEGAGFLLSTQLLHGPGSLELAIRQGGVGRLVFASGTPFSAPGAALAVIQAADLDESDRERILGGNLAGLLDGKALA